MLASNFINAQRVMKSNKKQLGLLHIAIKIPQLIVTCIEASA